MLSLSGTQCAEVNNLENIFRNFDFFDGANCFKHFGRLHKHFAVQIDLVDM